MNTIEDVFPNIIHSKNRGGLAERWDRAKQHECRYIEMPAPFVHSKTEKDLTGQAYGELLTSDTIECLYTEGSALPDGLEYILHTDPGFDTTGSGNGICYTPKYLRWYNREWVEAYARMLIEIADHLGRVPHTIEIHPGSPKTTPAHYVLAMNILQTVFEEHTGQKPDIVLENLTVSHVYSGVHLAEIGELLELTNPDMAESCGFVVDVSGIWTANKQKKETYQVSFDAIPTRAVKGLHVHLKHQPVDEAQNPAFWTYFREWMRTIDHPVFINPEIHTMKAFQELYPYCRELSVKEGKGTGGSAVHPCSGTGMSLFCGEPDPSSSSVSISSSLATHNYSSGRNSMEISSLRKINSILERDAKTTSYKFALLRGTIDVCQKYSHRKVEDEGRVRYPLGPLVESGVRYYYPIIDSPVFIPQGSGESDGNPGGRQIRFRPEFTKVTDYYRDHRGFNGFWKDYRNGEIPEEISPDVMVLFKKIRETIILYPMKHIGRSKSDELNSIYQSDKAGIRIPDDAYPDREFILENFGYFDIPTEVGMAFEYLGSFISGEESILENWAEFSHKKTEKNNEPVPKADILTLLTTEPETKRVVDLAKQVYLDALWEGPLECVWSGKIIRDESMMAVDHMLPFAQWKNNDLWNLLPAEKTVNGKKTDLIPSRILLERRKDIITEYWDRLYEAYPAQFSKEISISLLGKPFAEQENWKEEAFANLLQKVDYHTEVRGYESWDPLSS